MWEVIMDKQSFITSVDKYLYGMKKLARYDLNTTKDLFLLSIIGTLQDWSCWFELSDCEYNHLSELAKCIVINNSDLELYQPEQLGVYTNVNTPQTDHSWTRNFDNKNVKSTGSLNSYYILFEDGVYTDFENENNIIQEKNYG